jgi:hypothetical protein
MTMTRPRSKVRLLTSNGMACYWLVRNGVQISHLSRQLLRKENGPPKRAACFYFFLPDPDVGCQPDAAPFWLGAAAIILTLSFFGFLDSRLPFCSPLAMPFSLVGNQANTSGCRAAFNKTGQPRVSSDTPNNDARIIVAPGVLLSAFEILVTPAFDFAIVFNCFTSSLDHARRIVALDFLAISIPNF